MVSEGFRATILPLIPPETRNTAQSPRLWENSENVANLLKNPVQNDTVSGFQQLFILEVADRWGGIVEGFGVV